MKDNIKNLKYLADNWRSKPDSSGWVPDAGTRVLIVAAANRYSGEEPLLKGLILVGSRHWSATMRSQADALGFEDYPHFEEGFIDQFDRFWSREEAFEITQIEGQGLIDLGFNPGPRLFSENLY